MTLIRHTDQQEREVQESMRRDRKRLRLLKQREAERAVRDPHMQEVARSDA